MMTRRREAALERDLAEAPFSIIPTTVLSDTTLQ